MDTLTTTANPFDFFDQILCINLDTQTERWATMRSRFRDLGIGDRVERIPAVHTPRNHHVGCALSHRRAIAHAADAGARNVLVLEDDAVFIEGTLWLLARALEDLQRQDHWCVLHLGGSGDLAVSRWRSRLPMAAGSRYLEEARNIILAHANAYNAPVFGQLLSELPDQEEAMARWIADMGEIDVYIAAMLRDGVFRTVPNIAAQEQFAALEDPDLRDLYHFNGLSTIVPARSPASPSDTIPTEALHPGALPDEEDPCLLDLRARYDRHDAGYMNDNLHMWGKSGIPRLSMYLPRFRGVLDLETACFLSAEQSLSWWADTVVRQDRTNLLARLNEDGAFGARCVPYAGELISADRLASASQLLFLRHSGVIDDDAELSVLDIGACYGRLAHRTLEAFPNTIRYACLDSVPECTYLSAYYLRHRGLVPGRALVVPADRFDTLDAHAWDLAVAIRSFDEMSLTNIEAWLDILDQLGVNRLFTATAAPGLTLTCEVGQLTLDFAPVLREHGFHLAAHEPAMPMALDRSRTGYDEYHMLWRR